MCPISDPDIRTIRQAINRSVEAIEKQINLLAQRLLHSQRRLYELQAKQQKLPNYKESSD